jgi:hypothetical protein
MYSKETTIYYEYRDNSHLETGKFMEITSLQIKKQ